MNGSPSIALSDKEALALFRHVRRTAHVIAEPERSHILKYLQEDCELRIAQTEIDCEQEHAARTNLRMMSRRWHDSEHHSAPYAECQEELCKETRAILLATQLQ